MSLCLIFVLTAISFTSEVQTYLALPTQQKVPVGEQLKLDLDFPAEIMERLSVYVETETEGVLQSDGSDFKDKVFGFTKSWPMAVNPGKVDLQLKLFGFIPLRSMAVSVVSQPQVYPGGQSIGVMLQSQGVMVVGYSPIKGTDGKQHFPAKSAGVQMGDQIISIGGKRISTDKEAAQLIDRLGSDGKPIAIMLERKGKKFKASIQPQFCVETQRYRIGLYIRDSAAGVGTLSFYEPRTKAYGALGHIIMDNQTQQQINLGNGEIVSAAIHGIEQGKKGQPGEKIGIFQDNGIQGDINKNTTVGIFGRLSSKPANPFFEKPLPVAFVDQINTGPAKVYTVVNGRKIEEFTIEIERVLPQNRLEGKGMVVRITDPKLLSITGGIIQGMSGSPIVQNNRIIGAVTHVFINDPTRGYAVPAEWMIQETSISEQQTSQNAS